jgi:NitT/TauT family transport system substrate-binding protein
MIAETRIGYLSTIYHSSFILRSCSQLEEIGIKASWKLFPNGPAMLDAFEKEEIDLGYLGLPPAIIGISKGLKIKCVAGGHVEGTVLIGGQSFQVKETAKDALAQFKDKTIGTPRSGSIHDVILRKIIKDSGFGNSIEIKNFEWADFILDAMIDGEIDGACGTPPLAILAKRQLEAKIILPPCKTWTFNPSYGIIATNRLILKSPSLIENFLKLHEDACNLLRKNPKEAGRLVHNVMKIIDEDFAMEVFQISPKYCASLPDEYIDSTMAFIPALKEMGYIARDLSKEKIFFTEFIEKIHPQGHHYCDL